MKREEAKIQFLSLNGNDIFVSGKGVDLINKIFDDFDIEDISNSPSVAYEDGYQEGIKENLKKIEALKKEIVKSFESRVCENCKYYNSMNESSGLCEHKGLPPLGVDNDFGCNKYQPTENLIGGSVRLRVEG